MKKIIFKFIIIILIIFIYAFLFELPSDQIPKYAVIDSLLTLKLSFVGDIMCHLPQLESARIGTDSFDFNPTFSKVKKYLINSDLTFGNLETVIDKNKKNSGYPNFNSPPELIEALSAVGFDVLFTSNNHSFDQGMEGIFNTINTVKNFGMTPIGTFISQQDYDSLRIINRNGFKIGILAFTYGLNCNFPKENKFIIKIIDTTLIKREIKRLKNKNLDIILIYYHFGEEYHYKPSYFQKMIVEKTIEYGADIIVASHSHVVQPIVFFNSNKNNLKKGIVAYSLGNFISNQRWRYSDSGVILNITINKFNNNVWIDSISIIPTWVYKGNTKRGTEFIILPCDSTLLKNKPSFLSFDDIKKIKRSYFDTYKMFLPNN